MDDSKVQVIHDWPRPRRLKDVQAFLGFANFYRYFIKNYSQIVLPLTYLTRKDVAWNWSADCENVFKSLKSAFTMVPVLAHWDPTTQIIVETDISDSALAAILSTYKDNELHPLAFQAAEQNYDMHDKELLAIFEAFKR